MKNVLWVIPLALLFTVSCSKLKKENEEEKKALTEAVEDPPTSVKALLMEEQDFSYDLMSNGSVGAMRKAELKFQSHEVIDKIYVKNGSLVKEGEVIAMLDTYKLKSSLLAAEDSKERALLDLQDVLIGQGYSFKDSAEIPAEVLRIAKIRSNYDNAINNHAMAKYNLERATLRAPFSGQIANLWNKEYNYPSGDFFCTVLDSQSPEVSFNVLESEISLVNLNDKVVVSPFSSPDHLVEGRVSEINPMVDNNGMVRVKAVIQNKGNKFYEGMNVKVRVQRLLGKRLVVPKSALVMRTNRKVIFTVQNNRAKWNYVETAQENSDSYVVVDGIHAGDSVIYEGNINLAHESPIILNKR